MLLGPNTFSSKSLNGFIHLIKKPHNYIGKATMSLVRLLFPHVCYFVENSHFRSKYPQLIQIMCDEIAEELIHKYVVHDRYEYLIYPYLDGCWVQWHQTEDYDDDIREFVNDDFIFAITKDVLQLENIYSTYKSTIFNILINHTCADVAKEISAFLQDDLCKVVEFIITHKEQYITKFCDRKYWNGEFIKLRDLHFMDSYSRSTKRTF